MPAQRLAVVVSSHPAIPRPFLLRFVESSTRIELAYSNIDQA